MSQKLRSLSPIKSFITKYLGAAFTKQSKEEIIFLPGSSFITKAIEIPEAITPKELHSYLELSLEEFSPFPVEQLYWGYTHDASAHKALLYATRREGHSSSNKVIRNAYHVFPSFLPSCIHTKTKNSRMDTLLNGTVLSFIFFETESSIPIRIVNEELVLPELKNEDDEIDIKAIWECAFKQQREFFQTVNTEVFPPKTGITLLSSAQQNGDEAITIELKHIETLADDGTLLSPIVFNRGPIRWAADIRDPEFKEREQQNRILNRRLWKGMQGAVVLIILLLGLELMQWTGKGRLSGKMKTAIAQQPLVSTISNKNDLLEKMDHFSGLDLRPFYMIGIINETRPSGIYFQSVAARDVNLLTIKGLASSVDQVNDYTDELHGNSKLGDIDLVDISTRKGEVQFTLNIRFNSLSGGNS